ncbi:PaaI family thioesterase [Massilia sp. SM-13]|uniref:PaaI family thioesterase n=1 Tax=Pseudoduganella rhizocola TaxID=3382643 RepID=UPI0038B546B5
MDKTKFTLDYFNGFARGRLPDHLGIRITAVGDGELSAEIEIAHHHLAPNGYLHAGTIVTLADTACGYGCFAHLPEGAENFTTVELKSNHLGTAREGVIAVTAKAVHLGKTTQVWDATVSNKANGKTLALFRCTQMVLYPKQ